MLVHNIHTKGSIERKLQKASIIGVHICELAINDQNFEKLLDPNFSIIAKGPSLKELCNLAICGCIGVNSLLFFEFRLHLCHLIMKTK